MIIKIRNLKAETLLGAYNKERVKPRLVIINLIIDIDHAAAVASDKLKDTVDYAAIEHEIMESLPKQTFALLEGLAEKVASLVMAYPTVRQVTVEIEKPGVMLHAQSVSVIHTVTR